VRRSAFAAAAVMVAAMGLAACGEKPSASGGVYTSIDAFHPINVSAPINPYNGQSNAYQGYNAMKLGWAKNHLTDLNAYYPGIAQSWQMSADGGTLTVKLQPNAKWSDGTPVTGEDIKVSAAVAFTQGGSAFAVTPGTAGALADVRVVDDKTVEFVQVTGSRSNVFQRNILELWVLPKSVYGPELPANFWDLVKTGGSTDAAQADAAKKARDDIAALGKKLVAFGPPKDVSAGPFVLESVNPGEALLVKNKHFHDAGKIGPEQVKLRNYADNQAIWNYLIAGELDSAPYTSTPTEVVNQILKVPNSKKITGLSQVSASLAFNQKYAPFDKLEVRQALAYLIDRAQVQRIAEPDSGKVAEHTSGLVEDAAKEWIGNEVGKLDAYALDKAKAESLLTRAGLTKTNGKWMLPNGQPFGFTIQVPAPFSDWVAAAKNISSQLIEVGIAAQAQTSADFATYQKEMADGKYAAGLWLIALGPSTYNAYARIYGAANGWAAFGGSVTHSPAGTKGNWIGGTETADVPGLGVTNPGQLTYQLSQLPVDQQKDTLVKLAKYTNHQLPAIQLWNYVNVQFVNETRYTNFPPENCECLRLPHGVWMQLGYIKKK